MRNKGGIENEKMLLGIAILLAGILLQLSVGDPLHYIDWVIGIIGLAFVIVGAVDKSDKSGKE